MGKFLLVAIVFAALVYGCFWLVERRRSARAARLNPPRTRPRAVGPDDDEDFLRDLNRRNRRNRRKDEDKPGTD